jgi:ParB family transcriptional regulator, chromosome partitioning protein
MQMEFHQLDRRWEHLRVHEPRQQHHLLASLAENGQQTPIIVVADEGHLERYVVINGFKRIAALQQLGWDTVEATVWAISEAEALLLERALRVSPQETALEQGWLLAEMEQRFRYSLEELARRFDRSVSWVSRRLALVELLPEAVQEQVRAGKIAAQIAMRYLAPVARVSLADCERMSAVFVEHRCDSRQAGQLYAAWREGTRAARERILAEPALFLKTQRTPPATTPAAVELRRELEMAVAILHRANRRLTEAAAQMNGQQLEQTQHQIESARRELNRMSERIGKETKHAEPGTTGRDSGAVHAGSEHTPDRAGVEAVAIDGAQGSAIELYRRSGNPPVGEGRTLPATDPRAFDHLQGESRASP